MATRRRTRRSMPVFVEEEESSDASGATEAAASGASSTSPDSGLFDQTFCSSPGTRIPDTEVQQSRSKTLKRKRSYSRSAPGSPDSLSAASLSLDSPATASPTHEPEQQEQESGYDLFDDTIQPSTQPQHRLKTPKQSKFSYFSSAVSSGSRRRSAGTQSVDRRATTGRSRSGRKKALFGLKKNQGPGAGEVSLWDLCAAKNKKLAQWISEREKLDQQLDQQELSVTFEDTFPDPLNSTI